MKKYTPVLIMVLLLSLLLGGALNAQGDDILIVATGLDDVITLDPARAFETTNLTIFHAVYETLVEIRPDDLTTIVPLLAESWEVSDDGLVYTFTLREGLTFASGNPITAEDVRFSWMRLQNVKGNPSFYITDAGVESIEVLDELTVQVTLAAPYPAFLSVVTAPALSITDSKVVMENGGTDADDADATDTAKDWLDQNSAGSGPFVLTGWTPNSEVVMVRNENYWGEKPAIAGVTLRNVNDSSTALQLLERGDVDIVQSIDTDLVQQVEGNSDLVTRVGQTLNLTYLAISPSDFFELPLSDARVRQAIAYAVDYDGILDQLYLGYADRPAAMLPLGIQGSDPALRYTRDLDKARALLEEAGYGGGFDLTLYIGSGTAAGIPTETLAAKIQADLAEIGITLTINQQTTSNFLTAFRAQELPMVMSGWTPDYLDATMWSDFYSYADSGVAKRIRMDAPEIAEIAVKAGSERDPQARTALYADYQKAHVAQAVFIPLVQPQFVDVLRADVQGYAFHPVYFIEFSGMSKGS